MRNRDRRDFLKRSGLLAGAAGALASPAAAQSAAQTPRGEWVVAGSGWQVAFLAEGRYPTRWELDRVAPEHPVWLPRVGHAGVANSLALQLAGVSRETPASSCPTAPGTRR